MDSSEWVFCRHVFHNLCLKLGTAAVDSFASRVSHQVAQYVAWKPDPYSIATDVMSIFWTQRHCYAFLPFLSDSPCTKGNTTRPSTHSNIDKTLLANTVVVSTTVANANKETNYNTKFNLTFSRSKRESTSISVEQNSYISGVAVVKYNEVIKKISSLFFSFFLTKRFLSRTKTRYKQKSTNKTKII